MFRLPKTADFLNSRSVRTSILLLTGFALFSFLVFLRLSSAVDVLATELLQILIPRLFDTPFSVLSLLGTFEVTTIILLFFLLKSKLSWLQMGVLFTGFVAILGIETTLKHLLQHPRPPSNYHRYDLPIFLPTSRVETPFAYPSGHLSRTAFLLVIAFFLLPRKNKTNDPAVALLTVGFLMAVSRVYLGEHWTSDVIGGSLLGSGVGYLTWGFSSLLTVSTR